MECRVCLLFASLWCLSSTNPAPQFYPLPFPPPSYGNPLDTSFSGSQVWPQTLQKNLTTPNFIDPLSAAAGEEFLKNNIPRQLYGAPPPPGYGGPPLQGYGGPPPNYYGGPPPSLGYPQVYRIDNLIIIANPSPQQAQPCIPQRPPPNFPNPRPKPPGDQEDGLGNRFGDEPTKCTWAIVACCSPDNANVRYNCFELLGCPGFFFDNSPCEPKIVMAAANAALEFYSNSANNNSSTATDNNRV